MRRLILVMAALCSAAWGQHSNAYVYGGVTGIPGRQIYTYWHGTYVQAGAGVQGSLGHHFTLGVDVTGLLGVQNTQNNAAIVSVGPGFHFFGDRDRKIDPFVSGGGAALISSGAGVMYHFGGGANYWFRPRIALRFEFRDHVWLTEGERVHFPGFRAGLTFR